MTSCYMYFAAIKMVYEAGSGSSRYQVSTIDEIGPKCATNLCYIKGHCIDCNKSGEMGTYCKYKRV